MLGVRCADGGWLALPHLTRRAAALVAALELVDRASLAGDGLRRDALEHLAVVASELAVDLAPLTLDD